MRLFSNLRLQYKRGPKVFLIGFNKCGTKTFHDFFRNNGLNSLHFRQRYGPFKGAHLATSMEANVAGGKKVLDGVSQYNAYSDMVFVDNEKAIEANRFFRELDTDYPGSRFILNDRPVDDWIRSRLNHEGGPHGSFVGRWQKATGLSRDEVIVAWRTGYFKHRQLVLEYFADRPEFMHFDLTNNTANDLHDFLSSDYRLDVTRWTVRGATSQRNKKYRSS